MFRKLIYAFFVLALLGAAVPAQAAPIAFVYTETDQFNTAFGSFTFDDTLLDGTSAQFIPHSTITAFSFTFNVQSFDLIDLNTAASFIFDNTEPIPDVIGAAGTTAANGGGVSLTFLSTGGASLIPGGQVSSSQGDWNVGADPSAPVPEPSTILGYFLSYKVRRTKGTPKFEKQEITLTDQFESGVLFEVKKPKEIYNPADNNGEGIIDPDTHLVGYKIKRVKGEPKHEEQTNIRVENQFGTIIVDTVKPDRLLVPSAKSLTNPIVPLATEPIDHFKCYKVEVTEGTLNTSEGIQVTVGDQFTDPPEFFEVEGPKRLCNPVDINGEGIQNPDDHLLCYTIRQVNLNGIHVNNQFGPLLLDTDKEEELCVPSTKELL